MTKLELLMVAVRTETYPVECYNEFSSRPCVTRGDWLMYGSPFWVLAAIRNDLEPLINEKGEIYSIPGFLRAKEELCETMEMDACRFAAIMAHSPKHMARLMREKAEGLK